MCISLLVMVLALLLLNTYVGVLAGASGFAVAAVRNDVEFVLLAGHAVEVRTTPWIVRHRLLEVWPAPARHVCRLCDQYLETLFGRGIALGVQAELVQCLFQRLDLRLRDLDLGLPDLREIARRN